mgnify:CR=1 FL=1
MLSSLRPLRILSWRMLSSLRPFPARITLLLLLMGPAGLAAEPVALEQAPALLACTHPAGFSIAAVGPGAPPAGVPWLRQLPTRSARLRGVPRGEALDGLAGTAVSLSTPLDVELASSAPIAYAEMEGSGPLSLRCDERAATASAPDGTARPFASCRGQLEDKGRFRVD